MDPILISRYEQSIYKEIYHFENIKSCQSIVLDEATRRIYLKKVLNVYDIQVFRFLKEHPNIHIPKIQAFWEEGSQLVVIEEYITGQTLKQLLEENPLDSEKKHQILLDLCEGIDFLHSATPPIIHRDIKPSNLMITDEGVLKIIDYDAAKVFKAESCQDTHLIGTSGIAAPEQYGFAQSDARTDIYAIGVLIRQLFPEDSFYMDIADKATEFHPRDRYQSVSELKQALCPSKKRRLLPPGFRSGKPWKMVTASLGYVLIFILTCSINYKGEATPAFQLGFKLCFLSICLGLIDLFTNYTGIFMKNPLLSHKNLLLRILGYMLSVFWILFSRIFILAFFGESRGQVP